MCMYIMFTSPLSEIYNIHNLTLRLPHRNKHIPCMYLEHLITKMNLLYFSHKAVKNIQEGKYILTEYETVFHYFTGEKSKPL